MALFEKKIKVIDSESCLKYTNQFVKNHVPKQYNQLKLLDQLMNEDIHHFVSISNRRDGKSFNYIHFMMNFAIEQDIGFCLVARHYTVRFLLQDFVRKIADTSDTINSRDIQFQRGDFYTTVIWREKRIGIITDLNQATDLKYASNLIEDYRIIIYDEFLALEGDYLPDEYEKMYTIYESLDRGPKRETFQHPKVFYLGNAVNFSSPILAGLDLFNILEKHPINTERVYDDVYLEMRRNDAANEQANTGAFKNRSDDMSKGQFTINYYQVANEKDRQQILNNPKYIYVKLNKSYLKITYNPLTHMVLLSITNHATDYQFNLQLNDNKESSIFLNESFFDENHYKKYDKGLYLFDNNFSKDMITNSFTNLEQLKIFKVIGLHELETQDRPDFERNEEVYNENYIERTKKALVKRFL